VFRIASLVAALTIVSKILGLARDLVIAHYFGTSVTSDAFNLAYMLTGNFFIVFGCIGGPFYSAIVASLPRVPENLKRRFLDNTIFKVTFALVAVAGSFYFFKQPIISLFIDRGQQLDYYATTLLHFDVLLPLIVLCGPIGILFGVLNTYKKYYEPSLSPAVINIALIAAVMMMGDANSGIALAIGTSVGAVLSFLLQVPSYSLIRSKFWKEPESLLGSQEKQSFQEIDEQLMPIDKQEPSFDDVNSKYKEIFYPALLSTGMAQLMVFIDGFFCRGLEEGSWTALVMGNRLVQMPLGVLLTAFLVPLFPRIAELASQADYDGIKTNVRKALKVVLAICIPGVIVGMLWTEEIVRLIFERGAFDARSTALLASVFFYLCLSIIPYIFRDTVTRIFYSLGDSRTPLYVAIFAILLKCVLNYFLVQAYAVVGIAISTVVISLVNFSLLAILLRGKMGKL